MTDLSRLEDSYLYHGGCQDEKEPVEILCECGHYCLEGDAHMLFGEAYCDECYQNYIEQLRERYEKLMEDNFTRFERVLLIDEEIV